MITQNFIDAIRLNTPLLAPGEEGMKGLTISNAIQLSTWLNDAVEFPLDENLYYEQLQKRIQQSKRKVIKGYRTLNVEGTH
ncbi:hypothetical protein AJ85_11715 [Alkalihalobacillus alcalophilus ATCC 27647 = CGMCC 1.3604]|uniref:Uncharacterized protein n=1 Tax=Alkalihalobacillus alcalophilus ATCC 27647 = CGMCC 1.3604 TaxID=1218173 RepID=A0A4S4JYC6_ALKAL|nr:hypothetical protein AJ85_11715 [Alkalihalobacillus alcalophilus ATCC 27647 = CGMCC 1.3604]